MGLYKFLLLSLLFGTKKVSSHKLSFIFDDEEVAHMKKVEEQDRRQD